MKKEIIIVLAALASAQLLGCGSKATDDQIQKMCRNSAEIEGHLQGASVEEAVKNAEEEWDFKAKKYKEDLARDLKGWDDVLAQKLADLEKAPLQPPPEDEPAADEADDKGKKAKKDKKKEKEPTIEELKQQREDQKKAILEDAEKKKKEIEDQYKPDFEKHEARKARAVKEAREIAEKRKAKADKAIEECIAKYKTSGVSAETAECRTKATSKKEWSACE